MHDIAWLTASQVACRAYQRLPSIPRTRGSVVFWYRLTLAPIEGNTPLRGIWHNPSILCKKWPVVAWHTGYHMPVTWYLVNRYRVPPPQPLKKSAGLMIGDFFPPHIRDSPPWTGNPHEKQPPHFRQDFENQAMQSEAIHGKTFAQVVAVPLLFKKRIYWNDLKWGICINIYYVLHICSKEV